MKLDTRLRAGEAITDREKFLLGVISFLDEMGCWYLDETPDLTRVLVDDFHYKRDE